MSRSWSQLPFDLKLKNFNRKQSDLSEQIHVLSGFKRVALACHNTGDTQAGRISGRKALSVYHTHSIVAVLLCPPPPPPLSSNWFYSLILSHSPCLSDNCVIWPYRGIWNAVAHLRAESNRYANSFRSRRFDKLDCSSWKTSFKRTDTATDPQSPPTFSFPPPSFILLSPFHLSASLLQSVELLLSRLKRALGLRQKPEKNTQMKKKGKKAWGWSIENIKWLGGGKRQGGDNIVDIRGGIAEDEEREWEQGEG